MAGGGKGQQIGRPPQQAGPLWQEGLRRPGGVILLTGPSKCRMQWDEHMSIECCAASAWAGAGPKAREVGGKRGHHRGQPSVLSGAVEAKLGEIRDLGMDNGSLGLG